MAQANLDLGILQETKLADDVYTCGLAGYSVVTTDAPRRHRRRVAVFYCASPQFYIEVLQKFRPNVVRFQLVTGDWQ